MMTTNDNEYSTSTVTNQSKTISSQETTNSTMSPTVQSSNANGEQPQQQPVLPTDNDLNQNESQEKLADTEPKPIETNEDDDEFIRITAAHQMLTEGKTHIQSLSFQFLIVCSSNIRREERISICVTSLSYLC